MSLFEKLMGVAESQLRSKSPIGSEIGDAIGTAFTERRNRKQAEVARTASLRHLKLSHLTPDQQRARLVEIAAEAGLLKE